MYLSQVSAPVCFYNLDKFCCREFSRVIDKRNVPPLGANQTAEFLESRTRGNGCLRHLSPGLEIRGAPAQHQHMCADVQAMLTEIRWAACHAEYQSLRSLPMHCQPPRPSGWFISERSVTTWRPASFPISIIKWESVTRLIEVFHESSQTDLYIQQDGLCPGSNLLAHNG